MKITAYAYTNQGGRSHNEDSIRTASLDNRQVFVLADGLGGHGAGEVASSLAAEAVLNGCLSPASIDEEALKDVILTANRTVLEGQSLPGQEDMRTTVVTLLLDGEQALWSHVGDSRLYRVSDGKIQQLTRDHSVTYRKYLGGEITRMDVYHDDDRSSLLRVLGKPTCTPETGSDSLHPGDAFLLCSDGFWEYVYEEEILADCLKSPGPSSWALSMLLRHIRRTPPGNDNFSLITVFVEDDV